MGMLELARAAYDSSAWRSAVDGLVAVDRSQPLSTDDVVLLAIAAHQCGEDDLSERSWQRAFRARVTDADEAAAARCAFFLGMSYLTRGDPIQGGAWIGRAEELLERVPDECAEHGFVLIPKGLAVLGADPVAALQLFSTAMAIGERCGDPDVSTLGRLGAGQCRLRLGQIDDGMHCLDQAMLAVVAHEVSPVIAGIVYCATIEACHEVVDIARARSWTNALSAWCESQPDLVPYRGRCLVHRAEIMQIDGHWGEATEEARRACSLLSEPPGQPPLGAALYQLGELQRLVGDVDAARDSYRRASEHGRDPQPGLALLELATGHAAAADAALARVLEEGAFPEDRTRQLAARVETALAVSDQPSAAAAAAELTTLGQSSEVTFVRAVAASARGLVAADGEELTVALREYRDAVMTFGELGAVYDVARTRERIASVLRAMGDVDGANLELDAARAAYERLGASLDLARLDEAESPVPANDRGAGLTGREAEVLRHLASGMTNRELANELVISEKTVARHLSNIFTKLGVSSRSAATAYAYQHDLV
jgi:DNA-binding NarL/FixJ family response regulator